MINPKEFIIKCCDGTLQECEFDFIKKGQNEKSVKGTVKRKINVLPDMMVLFDKAPMVEEFQKNNVVCSFAAADGSFTLGFSTHQKSHMVDLLSGLGFLSLVYSNRMSYSFRSSE